MDFYNNVLDNINTNIEFPELEDSTEIYDHMNERRKLYNKLETDEQFKKEYIEKDNNLSIDELNLINKIKKMGSYSHSNLDQKNIPESIPKQTQKQTSEQIPKQTSEKTPKQISEYTSEQISEQIPKYSNEKIESIDSILDDPTPEPKTGIIIKHVEKLILHIHL